MRALVISGGGSKGAYAGGVAEYLISKKSRNYDLFVGTSTGSLLLIHLALGKIDELFNVFTNVKQQDIFSWDPFTIRKKDDRQYAAINHFATITQFIRNKRTFGESKNLRKLIQSKISKKGFKKAKEIVSDLVVTVTNFSKGEIEYKSIKDCNYDEFCDWLWISCNAVPFMSLAVKNDNEYGDGGFGAVIPLKEAIDRGATEIDVIIMEPKLIKSTRIAGGNPFSLVASLFDFLIDQVKQSNIKDGEVIARNKNIPLNFYYTPHKLTENPLVFNKEQMISWWRQGYEYAAAKDLVHK